MSETVRLIADITSLIRAPVTVDGEFSSTGKTIGVEHVNSSYRLDADTILNGGYEHRSSWTFRLTHPKPKINVDESDVESYMESNREQESDTDD